MEVIGSEKTSGTRQSYQTRREHLGGNGSGQPIDLADEAWFSMSSQRVGHS